jgi:hypothetical protein
MGIVDTFSIAVSRSSSIILQNSLGLELRKHSMFSEENLSAMRHKYSEDRVREFSNRKGRRTFSSLT